VTKPEVVRNKMKKNRLFGMAEVADEGFHGIFQKHEKSPLREA